MSTLLSFSRSPNPPDVHRDAGWDPLDTSDPDRLDVKQAPGVRKERFERF